MLGDPNVKLKGWNWTGRVMQHEGGTEWHSIGNALNMDLDVLREVGCRFRNEKNAHDEWTLDDFREKMGDQWNDGYFQSAPDFLTAVIGKTGVDPSRIKIHNFFHLPTSGSLSAIASDIEINEPVFVAVLPQVPHSINFDLEFDTANGTTYHLNSVICLEHDHYTCYLRKFTSDGFLFYDDLHDYNGPFPGFESGEVIVYVQKQQQPPAEMKTPLVHCNDVPSSNLPLSNDRGSSLWNAVFVAIADSSDVSEALFGQTPPDFIERFRNHKAVPVNTDTDRYPNDARSMIGTIAQHQSVEYKIGYVKHGDVVLGVKQPPLLVLEAEAEPRSIKFKYSLDECMQFNGCTYVLRSIICFKHGHFSCYYLSREDKFAFYDPVDPNYSDKSKTAWPKPSQDWTVKLFVKQQDVRK